MEICVKCNEFPVATANNICISCFEYQYSKDRRELCKLLSLNKLLLLMDIGKNPGITFVQLKKNYTSDGTLASHLRSLEQKKLISVVKQFHYNKPQSLYYLSIDGTRMLKTFTNFYQDFNLKQTAQNNISSERKSRKEQILYHRLHDILERLQEPTNIYELSLAVQSSYTVVEPFVKKQLQLRTIQTMPHNPNKYILTENGKYVLRLIKELNKFITKWESNITIPNERAGRK